MSKFDKLYELPGSIYAPGSPVIIMAGALLKDAQGNVLAQLKLKSISDKAIKAVTGAILS